MLGNVSERSLLAICNHQVASSKPAVGTSNMHRTVCAVSKPARLIGEAGFLLSHLKLCNSMGYQQKDGFFVGISESQKSEYQQRARQWH